MRDGGGGRERERERKRGSPHGSSLPSPKEGKENTLRKCLCGAVCSRTDLAMF